MVIVLGKLVQPEHKIYLRYEERLSNIWDDNGKGIYFKFGKRSMEDSCYYIGIIDYCNLPSTAWTQISPTIMHKKWDTIQHPRSGIF